MYGLFIDQKVGVGVAADFLWNSRTEEQDLGGGSIRTVKDESSYMFPVLLFIAFDPIPDRMLHPMLKFGVGYNSMKYHLEASVSDPRNARNGYYYGLIFKLGVDGLYNLGERAAVFFGLDNEWADMRTTNDDLGLHSRRDMSGWGIHVGVRFLLLTRP